MQLWWVSQESSYPEKTQVASIASRIAALN